MLSSTTLLQFFYMNLVISGQVRVASGDREGRLGAKPGVAAVAGSPVGNLLFGALDQLPRLRDAAKASQIPGSVRLRSLRLPESDNEK